MPERVEVFIIADKLKERLLGKNLLGINTLGGQFIKKPLDYNNRVNQQLPIKIKKVFSKGKHIFIVFGKWVLTIHLGMSGYWTTKEGVKHNHLEIVYKDGTFKKGVISLFYNDYRRFGKINIIKKKFLDEKLNKLGHDVLYVNKEEFIEAFERKTVQKQQIFNFFHKQIYLCGIGNYLAAEILYRSKISPQRLIKDIERKEIKRMYRKMKRVLSGVIESQGCSIQDFKDENGERQGTYHNKLKVYNRYKDPLGNKVKTIKMMNGRTAHWVPKVQK